MKKLTTQMVLVLGMLLMAAPALACSDCRTPLDSAACCSVRIIEVSKLLKQHLHCEFPAHQCAHPLSTDREICLEPACHLSPVICDIDREICIEPPCHRPAFVLNPSVCCECGVELTGSRDLIVVCEQCRSGE